MKRRYPLVWIVGAVTLGSGVINLISAVGEIHPRYRALLRSLFPLEFLRLSRFLMLILGFALIVSSINIIKRKKRAFQIVLLLSILSIVFHLTKGLDFEEALFSLLLIVMLVLARKQFTVKSSIPDFRWGIARLLLATAAALGYGVFGFWLLDRRHFGIEFGVLNALRNTLRLLSFGETPQLVPRTRLAVWFLESIDLIAIVTIVYALYALFRPVIYKIGTLPHERDLAAKILELHGRSSLDYFKLWPDKSYVFSATQKSFLAFRVGGSFAIALADPVGPLEELRELIRSFQLMCEENDWRLAFLQTLPDFLPLYKELNLKKLKIGDEAVVQLKEFSLEGKRMKHFRHYQNQFEKSGIKAVRHEPPIPDSLVHLAKEASDDWLKIPGRRERGFTQGVFDPDYIRSTPLFAVQELQGRILAFANIIPSYAKGESTIDLMRHREDAPAGIMDYLFTKLFLDLREKGIERFSLGMAPMSGFQEKEEASPEERAVHYFLQRLNFLFSYSGLFQYKSKFATIWEPRYVVFQNVLDLPRLVIALANISEIRKR